ncbi:tRNA (adenosine(37)-N6)-threonylcarbamoyltransferase complex ATPase subunit type 1 TsaE [Thiohalocapsa halophila]
MTDAATLERVAADEAAQLAWGATLGALLCGQPGGPPGLARAGGLVFLNGDLGAGKTTLVRGLLRGLGHQGPVRSPTYTLVESFELPHALVHHLDLYRIADADELEYLGIRDLLDGASLVLVEWPERGAGVLPAPDLSVRIEQHDGGRKLCFTPAAAWRAALSARLPQAPTPAADR